MLRISPISLLLLMTIAVTPLGFVSCGSPKYKAYSGEENCGVCRNCSRCKHCKVRGGTCGVKKRISERR